MNLNQLPCQSREMMESRRERDSICEGGREGRERARKSEGGKGGDDAARLK